MLARVAAIFFERPPEMEVQTGAARRVVVVNDNEIRAAGAGLAAHAALQQDNRSGCSIGPCVLGWLLNQPEYDTTRIKSRLRGTVNLDVARTHRGSLTRLNAAMDLRVVNVLL